MADGRWQMANARAAVRTARLGAPGRQMALAQAWGLGALRLGFGLEVVFVQRGEPKGVCPFSVDPAVFQELAFASESDLLQEAAGGGVAAVAPAGDAVQL